jgi:hypothetical protein
LIADTFANLLWSHTDKFDPSAHARQITRRNAVEKGEGNSVTESEQEGVFREAGHSNLHDARRNSGRIDGLGPNLNRLVLHCFRDRSLPLQLALDFLQECPRMFVLRSDCVSNSRGSAFSGQVACMTYARGDNGGRVSRLRTGTNLGGGQLIPSRRQECATCGIASLVVRIHRLRLSNSFLLLTYAYGQRHKIPPTSTNSAENSAINQRLPLIWSSRRMVYV